MAALGQAATHVPQPWHSAVLTSDTLLVLVEDDGVVGAQVVADAAAGAVLLVDVGPHRLHHHRALADEAQHAGRCGRALGHRVGDVLWPLAARRQ